MTTDDRISLAVLTGDGIGPFGADTLHDLHSVTKSIVGLLYGIALAAGKVPTPDQLLLPQFPDCADLAADRRVPAAGHAATRPRGLDQTSIHGTHRGLRSLRRASRPDT